MFELSNPVRRRFWPKEGTISPCLQKLIFHPQAQAWSDHFEWSSDGSLVLGKTMVGRVSITALRMNRPELVISRKLWAKAGWHPPG